MNSNAVTKFVSWPVARTCNHVNFMPFRDEPLDQIRCKTTDPAANVRGIMKRNKADAE